MRTIGVGIIGWGFMGQTHTNALRALPLFYPGIDFTPRLVGVCSRDDKKAARAKELLGFDFSTGDYRELLAREDVEVVSICTPNALHEQMAVDALSAGKHVYIDKPLTVTEDAAGRVAEAARKASGKAQLALHNRFFPATMRAKELVLEGAIGNILSFSCRYLHSGSIDPNRPIGWKQREEGGALLDLGSHALDLITWLIGMPRDVLCAMRPLYESRPTHEGGIERALGEDHVLMALRMANGALGTVEASKIATGTCDDLMLEISGDRGAIRWNLMDANWLYFYDNTLPEAPLGGRRGFTRIECVGRYPAPGGAFLPHKNTVGWERAHLHCYYSFLTCVAHGGHPSPSMEEGAQLQRLMAAASRSARSGQWTSL